MTGLRCIAAAVAAVVLLPASASAQDAVDDVKRYDNYIRSPAYLAYVEARLNEMEPAPLAAECPKLKLGAREANWTVDDPQFAAGSTAPRSGRWIDRLSVDRCGKPATRNIFITVRGTELQPQAMIPGRTATSLQLQQQAVRIAAAQARIKTGCKDEFHVVDSAIDGRFQPGAPWKEDWTLMGCKTVIAIALTFSPDGRGGSAVTAKPKP